MTKYNLEALSGTGQWLLVELFTRLPKRVYKGDFTIRLIVGETELEDINPTIELIADALDRHIRDRAEELAQEKIYEIENILDEEIDDLVTAIRYKTETLSKKEDR